MLTVGIKRLPTSIAEVAPTILRRFGIDPPSYSAVQEIAA